jgi:hypothetical protein
MESITCVCTLCIANVHVYVLVHVYVWVYVYVWVLVYALVHVYVLVHDKQHMHMFKHTLYVWVHAACNNWNQINAHIRIYIHLRMYVS